MKFVRFAVQDSRHTGVLKEDTISVIEGNIFEKWNYTGQTFLVNEVKLLAPLEPNQIIGIGANYAFAKSELPKEMPSIPVFFFKPTSSVIGPNEDIVIPTAIKHVKFESELAVIIGKEAKNIAKEDVRDYIFGYTIGNDVTAPDYFHEDGHWTIGKSFDSFTPLGPVIETELDFKSIHVKAFLNGVEKQNSSTDLMIISVGEMIAYLSTVMTLKPGDVVLTGSPVGAELVSTNDIIECTIREIGTLQNPFVAEKERVNV
ncbi:fumarylacetoacetate hydrolase family protein [Bacillus megaterium]|nr:fumarylacetoacetate hydrolase family protein [Priestia megaterium]